MCKFLHDSQCASEYVRDVSEWFVIRACTQTEQKRTMHCTSRDS